MRFFRGFAWENNVPHETIYGVNNMKITLKRTDLLSADFGKIRKLYNTAFPADERAPMWLLAAKSYKKDVDFWSLYRDGNWFGMAYVLNYNDLSYLFYFAVSESERGKGLGSAALRSLKKMYEGRRLFLALEQLDENAGNCSERLKRRSFYLKNGLEPINCTIRECKVVYDVMGVGGDVLPLEYEKMMRNYLGFPMCELVSMDIKEKNVPRGTTTVNGRCEFCCAKHRETRKKFLSEEDI